LIFTFISKKKQNCIIDLPSDKVDWSLFFWLSCVKRCKQNFVEGEANFGQGLVLTQNARDDASTWSAQLAGVVTLITLEFFVSATSNAELINTKFVFKQYDSINKI